MKVTFNSANSEMRF